MDPRGKCTMNQNTKKSLPVSRKFWNYLSFLPASVRKKLVRSKFEVDYDLPKEITLKQAETEDEIKQAFQLVHDAYVDLDYIDANAARLRFSKFHAVATSIILVVKWEEEVIGTLTIIPDSALGLPCDMTWPVEKYRAQGKLIAEISSLSIKKHFRTRRGKLLMPLCKIMYKYCTEVLRLDGIVIATTVEVEPFYTDILLFEKVVQITGQEHQLVKGNPSSCCYLDLNKDSVLPNYKKTYGHLPKSKNLHHFFVEAETPNIIMPEPKDCIQAYMTKKNIAKGEIMKQFSFLSKDFTEHDKIVLKNLDISGTLPIVLRDREKQKTFDRESPRPGVRFQAWCFVGNGVQPIQCQVVDVSDKGFKLSLKNSSQAFKRGDSSVLVMEFQGRQLQCKFEVRWAHRDGIIGCMITETCRDWSFLIDHLLEELYGPATSESMATVIPIKKSA
jgi:hypothetical protein